MTAGQVAPIRDPSDLHTVRNLAARAADAAGLSGREHAASELVAAELATNLLRHARGGHLLINIIDPVPGTLQLAAVDDGPGINDITACMADGFSTAGSLGGGLGACRRAATMFDLYSLPGQGTVALAQIRRPADGGDEPVGGNGPSGHRGRQAQSIQVGGVLTPHPHQAVSGDGWCAMLPDDASALTIAVADGLGHGPHAAHAARRALDLIVQQPETDLRQRLAALDQPLRDTRGAAIALSRIEAHLSSDALVEFAGIGNIQAQMQSAAGNRSLASRPGVVGAGPLRRSIPCPPMPWNRPGVLVVTTDGIGRYDLAHYPGVHRNHPAVLAALVWRDAHRGTDDATVVVALPQKDTR